MGSRIPYFLLPCRVVGMDGFSIYERFINPQYASSLASIELLGSTKAASMVLVAVSGIILGVLCAVVFSIVLTGVSRVFKVNEALKFKHVFAAWWHTILINPLVFFINIAFLPVFRHLEDIKTVRVTQPLRATSVNLFSDFTIRVGVDVIFQVSSAS